MEQYTFILDEITNGNIPEKELYRRNNWRKNMDTILCDLINIWDRSYYNDRNIKFPF